MFHLPKTPVQVQIEEFPLEVDDTAAFAQILVQDDGLREELGVVVEPLE